MTDYNYTQEKMREIAIGAARSILREHGVSEPRFCSPEAALDHLDDFAREHPERTAAIWYLGASDNQIKLFKREWNKARPAYNPISIIPGNISEELTSEETIASATMTPNSFVLGSYVAKIEQINETHKILTIMNKDNKRRPYSVNVPIERSNKEILEDANPIIKNFQLEDLVIDQLVEIYKMQAESKGSHNPLEFNGMVRRVTKNMFWRLQQEPLNLITI